MPSIGAVMRLLRRRLRAAPDSDLLLRSVCHELRPSIAALSSLAKALDRAPAEGLRSELTRLTVAHGACHRRPRAGRRSSQPPTGTTLALGALHRLLPVAAACVPPQRLTVQATRAAGRSLVHPSHTPSRS
jgi:hypothetical protein